MNPILEQVLKQSINKKNVTNFINDLNKLKEDNNTIVKDFIDLVANFKSKFEESIKEPEPTKKHVSIDNYFKLLNDNIHIIDINNKHEMNSLLSCSEINHDNIKELQDMHIQFILFDFETNRILKTK